MSKTPTSAPGWYSFAADWESCSAKSSSQNDWKLCGSTPGKMKIAGGRMYRVTMNAKSWGPHLKEILESLPSSNIRRIRIPRDNIFTPQVVGEALASLGKLSYLGLISPGGSEDWLIEIPETTHRYVYLHLRGWTVDEASEAIGYIQHADELRIRLNGHKEGFRMANLFKVRGLKFIDVWHNAHEKQELNWAALSQQTELKKFSSKEGVFNEIFWKEFGKLTQIEELEMDSPEGSIAQSGSLRKLKCLKKLNGSFLDHEADLAISSLSECPSIDHVEIDLSTINQAMATSLGCIQSLKTCRLHAVQISDAGIQAMCHWPKSSPSIYQKIPVTRQY